MIIAENSKTNEAIQLFGFYALSRLKAIYEIRNPTDIIGCYDHLLKDNNLTPYLRVEHSIP